MESYVQRVQRQRSRGRTDLFKSVMGVFEEVGVHHFEEDEKGHDYDRPKPCTIL